ncbi:MULTISPECIES: hypothetical protein [Massilia]|uniref:Uncharacterized protein n=1 Tax=Massilia frigida TaxID=2609281 RepID=A0ABX0N5G9_9BURK|nr:MULTISPECIES: hypothetical protein [Massilia]MDQ1833221.1 hypothetical protein [Massilia sp. CCM 9029]NHZ80499.1 hypothetical protein [Massilia frigida]
MPRKFTTFDPFNSFSTDAQRFLDKKGSVPAWLKDNESDDLLQLWRIGSDAYHAIGEFETQADFEELFLEHQDGIRIFADVLTKEGTHLDFKNQDGVSWQPDFSITPSMEILCVFWQLADSRDKLFETISGHFLFACLEEIDMALMGRVTGTDYLHAVINAVRAFGNYQALATGNGELQKARSELAFLGAKEKHARDPKQGEKLFVLDCWKEWRQKPDSYRSKAAFARAMVDKCEYLESTKNIEDWCREWEKTFEL